VTEKRLNHYKIVAKIGEGGMGEVYRAEDTRLGRAVALKMLPAETAATVERLSRFQREARTVAALNHPNIVTLFSVEQAGDVHFLTMELVEGRGLNELLPNDGFPIEAFCAIALPIADALAAAHDRGIVHRDLKPANVMVTDEGMRVKVLDFGLAKLTGADEPSDDTEMVTRTAVTRAGSILGTPHYMSPEQARGEACDHRSDLFSFGVMLYEMATGERPFKGRNSIELLSSVLRDPVPSVYEINPGLPRGLGSIIERCLEKAPVARYQAASEIRDELRALRHGDAGSAKLTAAPADSDSGIRSGSPEAPWIAVLPLERPAGDPDLAGFADGLTDDITTGLSRFSYLLVISKNSMRKLEGKSIDTRRVGEELGARYVIEGSVRKGGERIRVGIQAVDARTGTHLWAETFDRNLAEAEIFDVQDEITDRVVATIASPNGVLARSMAAPTDEKKPEELTPYEAVLRFFLYQQRVSAEDHLPARAALERAVELEPGYADAWACLSTVLLDEDRHHFNPRPGALDAALRAAQRAVDADAANQLAHHSLAVAHYYRRELNAFRSAAEHAINLNRRDSHTLALMGILTGYSGDWERGIELTHEAMRLNPHHPGWYWFTTFFNHYHKGRYAEALSIAQKINMPEYFATHYATAIAQAQLGNLPGAEEAIREAKRLWPDFERGILGGHLDKWMFPQPDLIEHIVAGLELTGLDVRGSAAAEPSSSEPEPPDTVRSAARAVFVGRDDERARLDEMLDSARKGRGGLVLLGGEPGVGKTRLASEILEDGRERGMLALAGHAYEDETAPFVMSSEILEEMVRQLPEGALRGMLGNNAAEISRLLPELRTIYTDIPEPADVPPEQQQRHLFKNVLEFLSRSSAARPMVMLLDDLHWADESSLRLLDHIAARLGELPILMVGTYRDVEADIGKPFARSMATLVRQRLVERIQIDPFDENSVAGVLSALGGSEPPPVLAQAIHAATEGNVFFIEETFHHLSEEGRLFDEQGNWLTAIDVDRLDVPEGVRLVTARRLERLSKPTRRVLSVAAVMGLRFPLQLLEVAAPDGDAVVDSVEEAESAYLLKPATSGRELRYEFVHTLARQTLLGELSPLRQQRMHLAIADAIERLDTHKAHRHAADLAHHLVEAGASADPGRTLLWLRTAGENAVKASAPEEAVRYFDTALGLIADGRGEERAELLHRRGSARLSLGHREEFVADLQAAFDGFEATGTGDKAAAVASELSHMLIWNGRSSEARELADRALALVPEGDPASGCRVLTAQGLAFTMAGHAADAETAHTEAVRLARTLDAPALLGEALLNHALDRWQRLDGATMEPLAREAASIHRELNQEWKLAHCLWMLQAGLVFQGRFDEAEKINDELRPLARRNEDVGSLGCSALMNCTIQQARGNLAESSEHIRRSIELFEEGGFPWGVFSEGHYSVNALLVGDEEKARVAFEIAGANRIPGVSWSGCETCYWLSGKAHLGDTDVFESYETLRSELRPAGEAVPSGAVQLLEGCIEALVVSGHHDEAATLYPAMKDFLDRGLGVVAFTYGLHERFAGMAAAAGHDHDAAETHYKKALELAERLPHRVDQARVRYWYARMLLDRAGAADVVRAEKMLAEARPLAESMGLEGLLGSIDRLRAGSGITSSIEIDSRRTVAVLPFPLLAGAAEDDFLSVALAEAVSHGLSRNTELVVRPTSAVMRYAAGKADPLTVARELNVQIVVEGSIQRLGPQVRVQVQAWEPVRSETLLSRRIDGQMAELFALQDRLADTLADGMGLQRSGPSAAEPPTTNPRAYELYLRASERLLLYTKEGARAAIEQLNTVVELDPQFTAAWARLSSAAVTMAVLFEPDPRWYARAESAVGQTLKLDPGNAEAWAARGRILWSPDRGFRHAEALRCFGKTHSLHCHPHEGPLWEGVILLHIGLHEEARARLQEAQEEQPDDLIALLSLGETAHFEGNHVLAQELYERTLAHDPSHVYGNMFVQAGLLYLDQLDSAERGLTKAREIVGEDSLLRSAEALLWAKRGETNRVEECVEKAVGNLQSLSHAHHTRHYVAAALATAGQPERAIEQLRLAAETGLPNYPLFLVDPHFKSLKTRPDFKAFLAGLKPGWEAFRSEFGRGGD
jgi:TolB-like protein